ncbi:WD40/YVTN/BNR-like repeat-containing protein [Spirosoma linguale]|uniref:Glycosyl hydrolase, BNR repeat-containing protein n=1 Tax=Spirosoma linguale (strain ATCC 33905 / DSM 74 / LMG 10896 / Claus 1) TaxID=504472 RepID=D2QP17_SPILD|nr:glycosyl hydrolase, BNR repeat-containing protein [Spirosoma linguale DSM 74]
MIVHYTLNRLFLGLTFIFSAVTLHAQPFSSKLFDAMKWRMIGPHRGGRTVGATGVPQQPNVFYIGVNNGGVWKTTDYGRTWVPIFDDQPTGSIGDVAVAPSNPDVVYVASGEGLQRPDLSVGNGMYKSTDAGKTWAFLGLKDGQQIGGISIDPTNENRVFAAVLGHPYGPNTERGVYRTVDGGKKWERVLYKDENTGAVQVTIDPKNPNIVYADLWAARQGPWENGQWQGPESGLFKSTDGGTTWQKLTNGLPTVEQGLGRIGFCIAPSEPNRLYATVDAPELGGVYRSDNAGQSWTRINNDQRLWGRGSDFAEVKAHPTNPDIVFIADVAAWKSTDGGKTWNDFRGAPGGDDYHRLWINPNDPNTLLLAGDQGGIVTVNGGQTFSSWYNQPTAQFYHVSTDNSFPYNVLGGQQESGSVGIASRGNDGQITFHDWHPVGVEEYGYVAADPLDPNIIYGGKVTKFDKRTGQVQNIAPEAVRSGKYRFVRTAPVLFSPIDPKELYFAGNVLFKTRDGGNSWQVISPDLTRTSYPDIPESVGVYRTADMTTMPARGVIYTIAPSHKTINTIWVGTDDGLIQITRDGGKIWKNITPPGVGSWSKVSLIDAGHFDDNTAYAAVNRIRCDDLRPHIYRTHDGGKTWQEIVSGLPNDPINAVREDPSRKGLLFAGSETAVHVSFDDGDHWQPLRLNMPATSIRDLVIKDDDLVVGTHGRSFWILDDITPLRQLTADLAKAETILYKPQRAYRVRWNMNPDTPLPQEEPAGQNPPDGAVIDYFLKENAGQVVTLTIKEAAGAIVRQFSSDDKPYDVPDVNLPAYWIRPQQILSGGAGSHRFMWDLHYTPMPGPPSYPIAATYHQTAPEFTSPWVMPGTYTVTLTVGGKSYTQPLVVTMDPRVKTSLVALKQQHDLSVIVFEGRKSVMALQKEAQDFKGRSMTDTQKKTFSTLQMTLNGLNRAFSSLFGTLQDADMPPTTQAVAAVKEAQSVFGKLVGEWKAWKSTVR